MLVITICLLIMLSGCALSNNDETGESGITDISNIVSEESEAATVDDAWMEAYLEAIVNMEEAVIHITLVDIDFDEIPELFLSELGVHNIWIYKGMTYKDNKVVEITIQDNFMPIDLELYQDKETEEPLWIAEWEYKSGVSSGGSQWYKIGLNNEFKIITDYYFGYSYLETEESSRSENVIPEHIYTFYAEPNIDGPELPWDEIEKHIDLFFSNYEKIDAPYVASFAKDFLIDGEYILTPDTLINEKLLAFFHIWKELSDLNRH